MTELEGLTNDFITVEDKINSTRRKMNDASPGEEKEKFQKNLDKLESEKEVVSRVLLKVLKSKPDGVAIVNYTNKRVRLSISKTDYNGGKEGVSFSMV